MIRLNGYPVIATTFPDNTVQVWNLPEQALNPQESNIYWKYQFANEFFELAQLKHLLDEYGNDSRLTIHFLPYARQDKDISNSTTFGYWTFARLLASLQFSRITILDPHNHHAVAQANHYKLAPIVDVVYPIEDVLSLVRQLSIGRVVYPDKGAREKYSTLYKLPYVYADKIRDSSSGDIIGMTLHGNVKGHRVLIVDDICDGGRTFVKLADLLYQHGAHTVSLFTTYGIYSNGLYPMREAGIDRIFNYYGEAFESGGSICLKNHREG